MDQLLKIINSNLKGGHDVLELGCGNGKLINAVAENNSNINKIIAVDYFNEPDSLNKKIKFIKQNLEDFSIDGKFDLVIMNHVLEHIKNPLGLVEKIKSRLNNHGRILIVVPNRKGFGNEAKVYLPEHGKHYFLWDKESLQYSLERLGFVCRFYNMHKAGSHNPILKYIPILLRIENPNLICVAMLDI